MFELIDIDTNERKGIFRTYREAAIFVPSTNEYANLCRYRIDNYTVHIDDILFEIPGDESGLLIEIPREICGTKSKVNRIIDGEVVVLHRIGVP